MSVALGRSLGVAFDILVGSSVDLYFANLRCGMELDKAGVVMDSGTMVELCGLAGTALGNSVGLGPKMELGGLDMAL